MTTRKTPYQRIRYPWTTDVVNVADIQSMAADVDAGLVGIAKQAAEFSKFASFTAQRNAALSVAKATPIAVPFDTIKINNGVNSPLANATWWAAGSPTRLTAPVACVVLATGVCGYSIASAFGVNGAIQTNFVLNAGANTQGSKFNPQSAYTGQAWASCMTMWKLNAGDFLEMKTFWTGTPAGPLNVDLGQFPQASLAMIALTSVP